MMKDNPKLPYSVKDFPKTLPTLKYFNTQEPKNIKAFIGWDGLVVLDESIDLLDALKMYAKQYQLYAQSCGRCTPGKYGGRVLYEMLNKIQNSPEASVDDLAKLKEICNLMHKTAKCEIGKTTPKPILQALDTHIDVFTRNISKNKQKLNKSNIIKYKTPKEEEDFKLEGEASDGSQVYYKANTFAKEIQSHNINPDMHDAFNVLERFKLAVHSHSHNQTYISKITAPCTDMCPSHVDIPGYIEGVRDKRFLDSLSATRGSMPLAQVCGRVCPHPCEHACRRAILDEPISIMELKRVGASYEMEYNTPYMHPNFIEAQEDLKNKKVCVVGAGPGGLSASYYMALQGIKVDVYEALPVLGGAVATGVPNYRMPIVAYNHDIDMLKTLGVTFHTNYPITKENFLDIESKYDATVLAVGTRLSKKLGCINEDFSLEGYLPAIKFMDHVNLAEKFGLESIPDLTGKNVVCIGGGFTSMDVVRCCIRLNAKSVIMLYRRDEATIIKNTSSEEYHEAVEEGVKFDFLSAVHEIVSENGKVRSLKVDKFELKKVEGSPKGELVPLEGGGYTLECDIVIPAVSQELDASFLDESFGIGLTKRHTIDADPHSFSTPRKGVFACGDCVSGPLTIVNAVGQGRRVANVVKRYLLDGQISLSDDEKMEDLLKDVGVYDSSREVIGWMKGDKRAHSDKLEPSFRAKNFEEVNFGLDRKDAIKEAQRCMRCYYISMCVV
ncbi:hypothetical protein BKH43_03670 [Helicobacter sp. 13S00401-1]|uniref:FAD-dependent oxidoreductase n=1 Tax=Helicobacter sp. 13S00401-1 TaxID=1905758 RepID=UPI000BA5CD0E|nr:FAD-dependent oxidoreductase [Helicobacter sp. 13S00401-1]PAF50965.1 hypothetical protein BKH43_03670 [Helicobacter sp. 13S00401-1]